MAIPKRRLKPSEAEIRAIAEGSMPLDEEVQPDAQQDDQTHTQLPVESAAPGELPHAEQATSNVVQKQQGRAGSLRGNKEITTVGFNPRFLDHIDQAASMLNINRTAFINLAATHLVRATYREYLERLDSRPGKDS